MQVERGRGEEKRRREGKNEDRRGKIRRALDSEVEKRERKSIGQERMRRTEES